MKEQTAKLLDKAARAIQAAEGLLNLTHVDYAAGRAYYAMFFTAQALLSEKGLRSRRHTGIQALFGEHFAKPGRMDQKYHRWLINAFERRLEGDYGIELTIVPEEARELIEQAREFLREAQKSLERDQR